MEIRQVLAEMAPSLPAGVAMTIVLNKCDSAGDAPGIDTTNPDQTLVRLSAKTGEGMDTLREHLKACMGYQQGTEGAFSARRRHLHALERAKQCLLAGQAQLRNAGAGELLAEDLRQCHTALGEITGAVTSDALLGEIFSSFCIGK